MRLKSETVEQLAEALGVAVEQMTFEVSAYSAVHLATLDRYVTAHYGEAMARGAEWVERFGPAASLVSIEAHVSPFAYGTFAIRHLHHKSQWQGERDSGWRVMVANQLRGGIESTVAA